MAPDNLTAALINGLHRAWSTFKQGSFESSTARLSLLSVASLELAFGVDIPDAPQRVYRLGLSLSEAEADIEFIRSAGEHPPDEMDAHLSGLLAQAFEHELSSDLVRAALAPSPVEFDLARLESPSPHLH